MTASDNCRLGPELRTNPIGWDVVRVDYARDPFGSLAEEILMELGATQQQSEEIRPDLGLVGE